MSTGSNEMLFDAFSVYHYNTDAIKRTDFHDDLQLFFLSYSHF